MHTPRLAQSANLQNAAAQREAHGLAERLEQGELVTFSPCPFSLPSAEDSAFLFQQRLQSSKKHISYDPASGTISGFDFESGVQQSRLTSIMKTFALNTQEWLRKTLPRYASGWRPDRASFRPDEEATRKMRITARNDLLHIDAFPSRPSQGYRILRLYVNIHPTDHRVRSLHAALPSLPQVP
jgi:hypothetical protein